MDPTQETMNQVCAAIAPILSDPRDAELITRKLAISGLLRQADAIEHSNWRGRARHSEVSVEPLGRTAIVKLTLVAGEERYGLGLSLEHAERLSQLLLDGAAEARRIAPSAL